MNTANLLPAVLPLATLAVWEGATRAGILDPLFYPAPTALLALCGDMIRSGEITGHILATVLRMLAGFLIGASSGILLGGLMGAIPAVGRLLNFAILAGISTPKVTLLPMLVLLIGLGNAPGILVIAITCLVQMAVHTMDAVRNLNQTFVDMAANYGATRFMIFYDVYLPGCLPRLFTGMRLCLGVSFILTIAVELISGGEGLGRMLWLAWHTFYIEKVYIAVFASGCLGFLFQKSLRGLERRLIPWKGF